MWKYVTRRIRETFERGVNHFEKRSTTSGIVNPSGSVEEKNKPKGPPCRWFSRQKCWDSFTNDRNTNNERCSFDYLSRTWLGAITWSGALVVSWYTSQLIHLKLKYHSKDYKKKCHSFNDLISALYPYVNYVNKNPSELNTPSEIQNIIKNLTPNVHLISNDSEGQNQAASHSHSSSSNDDFEDTLNYIENKLGLAAIQNGQLKDGLNLLRSAANRNHAPAMYNLGLCYEMGIGLAINEKKAMELYRSAAGLEHPDALYNLGIYYAQGRGGLTKNRETATRFLKLAAVQGHQVAINTLKMFDEDDSQSQEDTKTELWNHQYPHCVQTNILPTYTSLYVDNVNYTSSISNTVEGLA